jgi:hypothetical protein
VVLLAHFSLLTPLGVLLIDLNFRTALLNPGLSRMHPWLTKSLKCKVHAVWGVAMNMGVVRGVWLPVPDFHPKKLATMHEAVFNIGRPRP